jgi:long-chain acyl-CoA synthetase
MNDDSSADQFAIDPITSRGFGSLSVATILADPAHRYPDRPAIIMGETRTTYGELWAGAMAYAGALRARGIGRGDRVAMLVPNVTDFPRVYYAILSLGAIAVPIHLLLKGEEIEYVLTDSGSKLVVIAAAMLAEGAKGAAAAGVPVVTVMLPDSMVKDVPIPRLEDEAALAEPLERYESVNPLDAATILYTSGTTGKPKGAVGSHLALVEQVQTALIDSFDMRVEDVLFGGLPLFHTFGQSSVMNVGFRRGAAILLIPRFEPDDVLAQMVRNKVTIMAGVPTMFIALLDAASRSGDRPPLRFCVSGGSGLPLAVLEKFERVFGAPVHEGYGLTETSPTVTFNHTRDEPVAGTVGRPIWGVDVEIANADVDDRIEFLPVGELGEVIVRGHALFKGYLHNDRANAESFVEGWFRTGDLGTKGEDDRVTIVDRKKDMIVRNGYNVYPTEVENVLARLDGVAQVAVFGIPDETHGQEVAAAVVHTAGSSLTEDEVIAYAKEHEAAYKYPRHVYFLDAMPLGASGKVLKRELQEMYKGV